MMNAGLLPITVVDEHRVRVWAKVFKNLSVHEDIEFRKNAAIALAMRQESPQLKELLAALQWTKKFRSGEFFGKSEKSLSPAMVAAKGHKTADLAACRWQCAVVGWHRPMASGVLPVSAQKGQASAIRSRKTIYPNGLWAHAVSKYDFALGGRWTTFEANVGLLAGTRGMANFRVVGDGKTLWKSPRIAQGQDIAVKVSVKGVKMLELHVDPVANNTSVWAVWMAPRLSRE